MSSVPRRVITALMLRREPALAFVDTEGFLLIRSTGRNLRLPARRLGPMILSRRRIPETLLLHFVVNIVCCVRWARKTEYQVRRMARCHSNCRHRVRFRWS